MSFMMTTCVRGAACLAHDADAATATAMLIAVAVQRSNRLGITIQT
jgi:hypothetical protein